MRLLLMGGARFVGRRRVAAALARGEALTRFIHGQSGPVPAGVEPRVGERRASLPALPGPGTG